jgi:hypothetical protein
VEDRAEANIPKAQDRVLGKHLCQSPLDPSPLLSPGFGHRCSLTGSGGRQTSECDAFLGAKPFHTPDVVAAQGVGQGGVYCRSFMADKTDSLRRTVIFSRPHSKSETELDEDLRSW